MLQLDLIEGTKPTNKKTQKPITTMAHIAATYTRAALASPSGQIEKKLAALLLAQPLAEIITLWSRGGTGRIGAPRGREIFYVTSTGGKWGKSAEVRQGIDLHRADAAKARAKAAAEHAAEQAKRLAKRDAEIATMSLTPLRLAVARFHAIEIVFPWWCGNTFGGSPEGRGGYAAAPISPTYGVYVTEARAVYASRADAEGVARADAVLAAL